MLLSVIASDPGYLDRRMASSPARSTGSFNEAHNDSLRSMKLKVHYTFDNENKTNHLVRWRDEVKVRTAFLDENTQVGVIELKTCINAIVNASPELVAKLGQDYTIYAYDYSEYETPLVGQGMLSWALASSKPLTPAEQSNTMITGRVCRTLGLFSSGAPETLEVRLRLVPVPTALQSEYINSMNKYRELSMVMPEGFDFQGWNDFLKANPSILSMLQSGNRSMISEISMGSIGIEQERQMINHGCIPSNEQDPVYLQHGASISGTHNGAQMSRAGSPAPSVQSIRSQHGQHSRPGSRLSNYPDRSHARQGTSSGPPDSGYLSNDERTDDARPRKRAKVTQANHPGKSSLGKKMDSLRIAASTAASLRVHQPTAVRPSDNPVSNLEEPPRVPTPIPQTANQVRRPRLPAYKSNLGRESFAAEESGYKSPYLVPKDPPSFPVSANTSPEADHLSNMDISPDEPASSPPTLPENINYQSSPALPPLRPQNEPGLMSSHLDELSADEDDDGDRPVNADDIEIAKQYNARPNLVFAQSHNAAASISEPRPGATSKKGRAERDKETISRDNARRAASLKRSQTWSGEAPTSDPATDVGSGKQADSAISPEESSKSRSRYNKWDKDKRKAAVQSKLAKSIATGELPPFCEVCGAIETPTWRKAFSKMYSGSSEGVKISKGDGAIVCCQILEKNEDGTTKLFKVFKKSLLRNDEAFSEVLLCNPCGLWLANRNKLRPENLWNTEKRKEDRGRPQRPSRSKKQRANTELTSDVFGSQYDAPSEALTVPIPDDSAESPAQPGNVTQTERQEEPKLLTINRLRGGNGDSEVAQSQISPENLLDPAAYAALEKAIESSPNRFRGSKSSPINIDRGTPDPARRTLFSSPKSSGPLGIDASERSPAKPKVASAPTVVQKRLAPNLEAGQELLPARSVTPDPFQDLTTALAPVTPSKTNTNQVMQTPSDLFKTPSNKSTQGQERISTNDFFSSAAKAFLHGPSTPSRTPSKSRNQNLDHLTPFTRNLSQLLSETMPIESSPSRFMGMFGDVRALPPLTNENAIPLDFDFSDFNPNSDLGLTSSPPRWYGLSEDATEGGVWEDVGFGSSPATDFNKEAVEVEKLAAPAEGV